MSVTVEELAAVPLTMAPRTDGRGKLWLYRDGVHFLTGPAELGRVLTSATGRKPNGWATRAVYLYLCDTATVVAWTGPPTCNKETAGPKPDRP